MKLDRLLNDFEFILKDASQFTHLRLNEPVYVKIKDLRVRQVNYDGFWEGEISALTVSFPDINEHDYNLRYSPGLIEGIEPLDKLMVQYNKKDADKKAIFQKMVVFGAERNFSVRNEQNPNKLWNQGKTETAVFKRNKEKLEIFLKTKKTNKKLSYLELPYNQNTFHYKVELNNGIKVFIRIGSFDFVPKDSFDKIATYLSKDMEVKKNQFGEKKTRFYFFQPILGDFVHQGSVQYKKMMSGSSKSLDKFIKDLLDPKD